MTTQRTTTAALSLVAVLGLLLATAATVHAKEFMAYEGPTANTAMLLHLDETSGTTIVNDNHANFSDIGDAATIGSPTLGVSGVNEFFGTALGVSPGNHVELHYPSLPDSWNDLAGNGVDYTFDAWVKWDPSASSGRQTMAQAILLRDGADTPYWWRLNLVPDTADSAHLQLEAPQGLNNNRFSSNTVAWDADLWYHIAFTQDVIDGADNEFNMYITPETETGSTFPVSVGTFTDSGDFYVPRSGGLTPPPSLGLYFGAGHPDRSVGAFAGLIDDVRISNAVMTDFPAATPEPATAVLFLLGAAAALRRRR